MERKMCILLPTIKPSGKITAFLPTLGNHECYEQRNETIENENPGIPDTYFKDWYSWHDSPLFRNIPRQHIRWRLSVVFREFIVNRYLVTGSEEHHLTGQGNSNAKH